MEKGAFVSVDVFGSVDPACEKLTGEISRILDSELGIPSNRVYVKHHGVPDWGWSGRNF